MSKVSMTQIAERLGVSKSLVSLALSNKYGVSDETRFKIYMTAIQMGFDFQTIKSSSNSKSRGKYDISVVIKRMDFMNGRLWPETLSGIEHIISQQNNRIHTVFFDDESDIESVLVEIVKNDTDGVIVISEIPNNILSKLKEMRMPVVIVDGKEYLDGLFDNVRANNYLGGYLVAEYLIKKGHKKIAFVGDIEYYVSFKERHNGFDDYIRKNKKGIEVIPIVSSAKYSPETEYLFAQEEVVMLLTDKENLPTAIVCANDTIAGYVYNILLQYDVRIPEDVSIIGFDNLEVTYSYKPKLTSVDVDKREMGQIAVKMLMERMLKQRKNICSQMLSVNIDEKKSVRDLNEGDKEND